MTAQTSHSMPATTEHDSQATHVAKTMKTPEIDRAAALAGSLRAMRRNAKSAYVSARPGACHSITMDSTRLGDLTDAADLIESLVAALSGKAVS